MADDLDAKLRAAAERRTKARSMGHGLTAAELTRQLDDLLDAKLAATHAVVQ